MQFFATLWTVACQTTLSVEFSRQEHWSGLPCPPLGIVLIQVLNLHLLHCRWIRYHWATGEDPRGGKCAMQARLKEPDKVEGIFFSQVFNLSPELLQSLKVTSWVLFLEAKLMIVHFHSTPTLRYAKSLQSCPTLCDPIDGSLPGSPVPGIL